MVPKRRTLGFCEAILGRGGGSQKETLDDCGVVEILLHERF